MNKHMEIKIKLITGDYETGIVNNIEELREACKTGFLCLDKSKRLEIGGIRVEGQQIIPMTSIVKIVIGKK